MSEFKTMLAPETGGLADPRRDPASALSELRIPLLLFGLCLAAQLYLVFSKSFNWDEFLHFSQVYQLRAGTLTQTVQVLHTRILWWAPDVSRDLLVQMRSARVFIWGTHLVTLFMIYGIARRFTAAPNAFFASFAYLSAGYVFTQGFSIRADPLVTATLMFALFLLISGKLSLGKAIAVGSLVGLAGMMTFKAMFFAPCFAGVAWLRLRETPEKFGLVLGRLALLAMAAIASFWLVYLYHTSGMPEAEQGLRNPSSVAFYLRWLTPDLPFKAYIGREIILAPLFFLCLILAPRAWRQAGLTKDAQIALAGFAAPLLVLLFYRNSFPYFFVFILAPVAVAIAPALGLVRDRYGNVFLSAVLAAMPLALTAMEPRDVIERQRALIDYVHQEFPERTGYLDYSGMISDYPRILKYLTSGNGIRHYREQGNPIIGREIARGNLPFVIANQHTILAALDGRPEVGSFLPADLAAMDGNYVRQWGALWREGKRIAPGRDAFAFDLHRGGKFVLAGAPVTIDGVNVSNGVAIRLEKGPHSVGGKRAVESILWRGEKLPSPPPRIAADDLFTDF